MKGIVIGEVPFGTIKIHTFEICISSAIIISILNSLKSVFQRVKIIYDCRDIRFVCGNMCDVQAFRFDLSIFVSLNNFCFLFFFNLFYESAQQMVKCLAMPFYFTIIIVLELMSLFCSISLLQIWMFAKNNKFINKKKITFLFSIIRVCVIKMLKNYNRLISEWAYSCLHWIVIVPTFGCSLLFPFRLFHILCYFSWKLNYM